MKASLLLGASSACILLSVSSSFAQGVGQRTDQDVVIVVGERQFLTALDATAARNALERVPGAIGFVESDDFADDFAQSLGDLLVFTPGVFADTSAQRENRLSIRGSGLNATFERRGVTVRRDGAPISRASGITEFQEIDPLTIDYIEIFKGANGLRYGASSLGGAINIVTPTGRTRSEKATLRFEGGSFGTARVSASISGANEKWDFYAGLTGLRSDGFRDHSAVKSVYGHANIGYQFDNGVETRTYFTGLSDNFELAGSLSLDQALTNPTSVAAPSFIPPAFGGNPFGQPPLFTGPVDDDWDRNLNVYRLANKTVIPLDLATVELGVWTATRELDHAITRFAGIIDQSEDEVGGSIRLTNDAQIAGLDLSWIIGGEAAFSWNEALRFENNFGVPGALRSGSDQTARNLLAYAQADLSLTARLTAVLGGQYLSTKRENTANLNDVSGAVSEAQFNPRFGLLYDVAENTQIFFNINRGFEPAGISDLTSGGVLDFTPLTAQRAWTTEIGTRGQTDSFSWDLSLYRSWIDNEFIDLAQPGFGGSTVSATFNADETIHQGVELGVDFYLTPRALKDRAIDLTWRHIYTFNDFFFSSDPQDLKGNRVAFDGNQLAGVPRHVYISEIRADHDNWYAAFNLRYVPNGPFADFANTVQTPGYTLLGVTMGVNVTDYATLFVSGENLTDKAYISNVATVADQSAENRDIFTPGQGRAFYGGLKLAF